MVQTKKTYAEQIASESRMRYEMVLSSGYADKAKALKISNIE